MWFLTSATKKTSPKKQKELPNLKLKTVSPQTYGWRHSGFDTVSLAAVVHCHHQQFHCSVLYFSLLVFHLPLLYIFTLIAKDTEVYVGVWKGDCALLSFYVFVAEI